MPSARRSLGDFGERAALAYLRRQGYRVLKQNWRCQLGEIDLIACEGDQVVIVEVRTRRGSDGIIPEETLSLAKQRRLAKLALQYFAEHTMPAEQAWRIDLIAVVIDRAGRVLRLNHIMHAVEEI